MWFPSLSINVFLALIGVHYCEGASRIDGKTIPKYTSDFFIPPVIHDDNEGHANFEVSFRQFEQQILPDGYPKTITWGFGDPNYPSSFHNPSGSIEVTEDTTTYLTWRNELVYDPEGCRQSNYTSEDACKHIPHVLQDQNGVPIIDQQVHWANPNQQCKNGQKKTDCEGITSDPYYGPIPMVTHVHGAHVESRSDGFAGSWFLPKASDIPEGYATEGSYFLSRFLPSDGVPDEGDKFRFDAVAGDKFFEPAADAARGQGYTVFRYTNDEPSTALWYHDHTLGITRLNVYAGAAGFWFIRGKNNHESGLADFDINGKPQKLPGPPPKFGQDPNGDLSVRKKIREIGIVIQGMSFYDDGRKFYPANRAYFDYPECNDGTVYAQNDLDASRILRNSDHQFTAPYLPDEKSDILPVLNPEAFFDTMVVNGKTWPKLNVAPERYRFRLLNACDSRTLNLALFVVDKNPTEIPFYVIGSDQGLLPRVVKVRTGYATRLAHGAEEDVQEDTQEWKEMALLVAPAERFDVIVDFSELPDGLEIIMTNTAPDDMYGGFDEDVEPADQDTTGQVMKFVVDHSLKNPDGDSSTSPYDLVLEKKTDLPQVDLTRDLALKEIASELCVQSEDCKLRQVDCSLGEIDEVSGENSLTYGPSIVQLGYDGSKGVDSVSLRRWSDPLDPKDTSPINSTEIWEIWNWTPDAHPIHVHLVAFELVGRYDVDDPSAETIRVQPWEEGQKDTVVCYSNTVTRIKLHFDKGGYFMWHCHILSHEDNEMMLPFCVGEPGKDCPESLFEV